MSKAAGNRGSIGSATLWMVGFSVLLFWIPPVGPLVAGFVGGRKAGDVGPAIVAAIIPAILVAALLFLVGTLVSLPVIGALVGAGLFFVIAFESVPLLIGALIGGALAEWSASYRELAVVRRRPAHANLAVERHGPPESGLDRADP
jgi:hypothetical protein